MNNKIKGKVSWHNGSAVLLSGETEKKFGAEWFLGHYLTGHRKGTAACVIATAPVEKFSDVEAAIEEENRNYDAFVASM